MTSSLLLLAASVRARRPTSQRPQVLGFQSLDISRPPYAPKPQVFKYQSSLGVRAAPNEIIDKESLSEWSILLESINSDRTAEMDEHEEASFTSAPFYVAQDSLCSSMTKSFTTQLGAKSFEEWCADVKHKREPGERFHPNMHRFFSLGVKPGSLSHDPSSDKDVSALAKEKAFDPITDNHHYRRYLLRENLYHSPEAIKKFELHCSAPPTLRVRLPENLHHPAGYEQEHRVIQSMEKEKERKMREMKSFARRVRFDVARTVAESRQQIEDEEEYYVTEGEHSATREDTEGSVVEKGKGEDSVIRGAGVEGFVVDREKDERSVAKSQWMPSDSETITEGAVAVSKPVMEDPSNTVSWPALSPNDKTSKSPSPKPDQKKMPKSVVEDDDEYRVPKPKRQKKRQESLRVKAMKSAAVQSGMKHSVSASSFDSERSYTGLDGEDDSAEGGSE